MQHYRSCCPSHQVCCTATSLLPRHACKQHMQVGCSTALAPLMCLTRASRFASSHATLPLMLPKSPSLLYSYKLAAKACMQAAHASELQHSTSTTDVLDKGQQVCKQPCNITAHLPKSSSLLYSYKLAAKACMQAAHASGLQHSTSTTDVLDKGQQVCKQPCNITAHAAQVTKSAVQLQACCQGMHASSTCKWVAAQH